MRPILRALALLFLVGAGSCGGGGDGGGAAGAVGEGKTGFVGLWQYPEGSFSFVNCYTTSRNVDLTRTGFQIVDEAGKLVRINPDGCRFSVVPSTATHAEGVPDERCTVQGTGADGKPLTTRYRLKSLVMELKPESSRMLEVFAIEAEQTSSLGTYTCEISGSNTLDRAP